MGGGSRSCPRSEAIDTERPELTRMGTHQSIFFPRPGRGILMLRSYYSSTISLEQNVDDRTYFTFELICTESWTAIQNQRCGECDRLTPTRLYIPLVDTGILTLGLSYLHGERHRRVRPR
jgi:hypothetical protein